MRTRELSLALMLVSASANAGQMLECVAAQVNDEILTRSDVVARKKAVLDDLHRLRLADDELKTQAKEAKERLIPGLIEEKLLLQKARDAGLEVGKDEMDRIVKSIMEQNQLSDEAALVRTLQAEGLTLAELRENIRRRSVIEKLKQYEIAAKVVVTAEEAERYYEAHRDEFKEPERVRLREIVLLTEGRTDDQVLKEIQELAKLIHNGSDFAELATLFSHAPTAEHGGDLGLRVEGELSAEIRDAAAKLAEGDVSAPIKTKFGYHIIKLVERKAVTFKSLENSREEITERIQQEQFDKKVQAYVAQLKERAYIKVNDACIASAM